MEILNKIWGIVAPYLAGISVGGVLTAIFYGVLKGAFNKTISKINVEKIANDATDKGIKKVEEISFKHSIQPLVNSELDKITEKANAYIQVEIGKIEEKYNNIINVLEKLSAYFDQSVFVNEETKAELKRAISIAKVPAIKEVESETKVAVVKEEKKLSKTER